MIEKVFNYSTGDEKAVERIIMGDNIDYIHMVFNKGEGMPEHFSNSNLYMTVVRGKLSIELDDQEVHEYARGSVLQIPYKIKMNIRNLNEEVLELIVVKAPSAKNYKE